MTKTTTTTTRRTRSKSPPPSSPNPSRKKKTHSDPPPHQDDTTTSTTSSELVQSPRESKVSKTTNILVELRYGGRVEEETPHPPLLPSMKYYESSFSGKSSETASVKKFVVKAPKSFDHVTFDDIFPEISSAFEEFSGSPISLDTSMLMCRTLSPLGLRLVALDPPGYRQVMYFPLRPFNRSEWAPSSEKVELILTLIPTSLTPVKKAPMKVSTPGNKEVTAPVGEVKLSIYRGGVKVDGHFLFEKNKRSSFLGDFPLRHPINHDTIVNAVDAAMMSSTLMCGLDPANDVICRENGEHQVSSRSGKGKESFLPEVIPIPATFVLAETFHAKTLTIVVFDKHIAESSFILASKPPGDAASDATFAMNTVKSWIVIGMKKRDPYHAVRGLIIEGGLAEQKIFEESTDRLVKWAYSKVSDSCGKGVKEVENAIIGFLEKLPRSEETNNLLPEGVCVNGCHFKKPTSLESSPTISATSTTTTSTASTNSSQQPTALPNLPIPNPSQLVFRGIVSDGPYASAGEPTFQCRSLLNDNAALSIGQIDKVLLNSIPIEVRLSKEKHRFQDGTWCLLHSAHSAPQVKSSNDNTFVVEAMNKDGENEKAKFKFEDFYIREINDDDLPLEED